MPDAARWPALVLAAGFGTRFRPLSYVRAKPAVPVSGTVLACRILSWLRASGVEHAVLNLHHKPETITAAVGDGSAVGIRVRYSWENPILGSAGGPARALRLIGAERFFIVNGDTLCAVDLGALRRQHEARGALVTMALVPNPDPARYGGVQLDPAGCVRGFPRAGTEANRDAWHFVGVQMVESAVFAALAPDRAADTVRDVYPALIAREPGRVQAFIGSAVFRDIGTPAEYLATSLAVAAAEGLPALPPGVGSSIAAGARLVRTAVWDRVKVGDGCVLTDCVVADDVELAPGTRLDRCAVVPAGACPLETGPRVRGSLLFAPLDPPSRRKDLA